MPTDSLQLFLKDIGKVRQALRPGPVSLEKPVGDEEESEFGQFITDERVPLRPRRGPADQRGTEGGRIENQSLKRLQQLGEARKLREVT